LFICVEGPSDRSFFQIVVEPRLRNRYERVIIWEYSGKSKKERRVFIRGVQANRQADYLWVGDLDDKPCVSAKKNDLIERVGQSLDDAKIVVVVKEIESWYLAGLDRDGCEKMDLRERRNTDSLTKEEFHGLIPKQFGSPIDFTKEVLKRFSVDEAVRKNGSFRYFYDRHLRGAGPSPSATSG
jgi:hypothetical protein